MGKHSGLLHSVMVGWCNAMQSVVKSEVTLDVCHVGRRRPRPRLNGTLANDDDNGARRGGSVPPSHELMTF